MKAVIFDLFETLVTEWGRPKYTTRQVALDLGIDHHVFRKEWSARNRDMMYIGKYTNTEQVYEEILNIMGITRDSKLLTQIADKRADYKRMCFEVIEPKIMNMLALLKSKDYKIGLISNCSPEEIIALHDCSLYPYFDAVVLSCDVGMKKPDIKIYEHCLTILEEQASNCFFVGDGGSDELSGAEKTGLIPLKALWFIKHHAKDFGSDSIYKSFYEPREMTYYIINHSLGEES